MSMLTVLSTDYLPPDNFLEIPPQITTEQLGPASIYLSNSDLFRLLKKQKEVGHKYAGKCGIGSRVFINKEEYGHLKVTRQRILD